MTDSMVSKLWNCTVWPPCLTLDVKPRDSAVSFAEMAKSLVLDKVKEMCENPNSEDSEGAVPGKT